eukprot:5557065-Pleurochrysis_carterae.AAC.5
MHLGVHLRMRLCMLLSMHLRILHTVFRNRPFLRDRLRPANAAEPVHCERALSPRGVRIAECATCGRHGGAICVGAPHACKRAAT